MAANNARVWGIDIGQCALKALRCDIDEDDPSVLVADAYDYIEYSKILSQPEADPEALIQEALETFLSRNSVKEDKVAISVSGQNGLSRFIKLPPVESKKIPDIVKYEARQQIPYSLDDVIWSYQSMPGGSEEDGFALETEVGLFAMKRDKVFNALLPLEEAGIEVDYIQLAPLSIFNTVVFDLLNDLPPVDEYDPDDPPESVVVLSFGTDNTDMVVTNGYRVWQRSIPIGGNHFTKALSKDLRLTFAKAEHLKRNATQAEDPKAVFQAMRPVFNDLLHQIQRSLEFFKGVDRNAKLGRFVGLGNAMKLPGLQRFLSQNLEVEVAPIEAYRGLSGGAVVAAPTFKENLLSYSVAYGLCLQGLGKSEIHTNLLPREIVTRRLIRDKKPWAVAVAAAILIGCTANYLGHWISWRSVRPELYASVMSVANSTSGTSRRLLNDHDEAMRKYDKQKKVAKSLEEVNQGRTDWLELLKAVDSAMPNLQKREKDIGKRAELHVDSIDCLPTKDLAAWFGSVKTLYEAEMKALNLQDESAPSPGAIGPDGMPTAEDPAGTPSPGGSVPGANPNGGAPTGPSGAGWIVEIKGFHYYNNHGIPGGLEGTKFVRDAFIKNLIQGSVTLPTPAGEKSIKIKDLGISYPLLVEKSRINQVNVIDEPKARLSGRGKDSAPGEEGDGELTGKGIPMIPLHRIDFTVQFIWQPLTPMQRKVVFGGQSGSHSGAMTASTAGGGE